jgi:MoxR-like ATPase
MKNYVTLLCTIDTNSKGRFELTPHAQVFNVRYFANTKFDMDSLGKYYKVRSTVVQRLVSGFRPTAEEYQGVCVALFGEKKNLILESIYAIKIGEEPKMSTSASFVVEVKSVAFPTPQAVRTQLEAISEVKALFSLTNITYAAVNQTGKPMRIAGAMEENTAIAVADILAGNGALVKVLEQATGKEVYAPTTPGGKPAKTTAKEEKVVAPKVDPEYFYVPETLRHISGAIGAMVQVPSFRLTSILISGPSGFGKTAFCAPLAKALGLKVSYHDMSRILETEEAFGTREIRKGDTEFLFNEFVHDVEAGGFVIVLDEINRTYPGALNAMLPLLDWRGETTIHGRRIVVGPRTVFVATRNVGSEYVGTQQSDAALTSRFAFSAVVDSIPLAEEVTLLYKRTGISKEDATKITRVANFIREQAELGVNVSPRNTLEIAQMVAAGINARAAYQWNVLLKIADPEQRMQVENILNRQFSMEYGASVAASKLQNIF